MSKLRAAILVISETAYQDPSTDRCSKVLSEAFREKGDGNWEVADTKIVPDDISNVQTAVKQWCDDESASINLIVTSGGTGFATKDTTPEAVNPLLHKHASGLVHGMLAASLAVTPFALMSRPVAGVRNKTLILTLPGSPKGATENLESVLKLLPHACTQAAGADSRLAHVGGVEKLERDAGFRNGMNASSMSSESRQDQSHSHSHSHSHTHSHSHSHGHGHGHSHGGHKVPTPHTDASSHPQSNDTSQGPSRRHRASPYPMLSVSEALQTISDKTPFPIARTVDLKQSVVGQVLAADVKAKEAVPAFRASIVDGYAVCIPESEKTNRKGIFPMAFASHAHAGDVPTLKQDQIARITTGAPLPPGSNAVVMVEDTTLKSRTDDDLEEREVEILTSEVTPGENVREIGSDVQAGDLIMRKGEGISAIGGEYGLLASVGTEQVQVYKKPRIGVLSTGDEIVPHDRTGDLKLGEVRDTNRPTLLTAAKTQGFEVVDLGIASDKPNTLESALRDALIKVDVLITTGGVSMGEFDLLKPTLERSLGGTIHFGRVSMKPGKPTTFATVPSSNIKNPQTGDRGDSSWDSKVIFSLPGNPASAVVTFMVFVLPSLHQMSGISPVGLPKLLVRLESTVKCDAQRAEYHRVVLSAKSGSEDATDGLWALSTGGQRSSRIGSFKGANALVMLPAGGGTIEKGTKVAALVMGPLASPVSD